MVGRGRGKPPDGVSKRSRSEAGAVAAPARPAAQAGLTADAS